MCSVLLNWQVNGALLFFLTVTLPALEHEHKPWSHTSARESPIWPGCAQPQGKSLLLSLVRGVSFLHCTIKASKKSKSFGSSGGLQGPHIRVTKMGVHAPNQALCGYEGRFLTYPVTPSAIMLSTTMLHLFFDLPTLPGNVFNFFLIPTVPHTKGWIKASQEPAQPLHCHFLLNNITPTSVCYDMFLRYLTLLLPEGKVTWVITEY